MELQTILDAYRNHQTVLDIQKSLAQKTSKGCLQGLSQSARALVVAAASNSQKLNLVILDTVEDAAYFYNDLQQVLPKAHVCYFPASFTNTSNFTKENNANSILRTEAFNLINSKKTKTYLVTYADALVEKVSSKKDLQENTLKLQVGEKVSIAFIEEMLHTYHFELVDFVHTPGQFSIRGSIVDIFSFSHDYPYRIDFFGDEIDSIRTFRIDNQLSQSNEKQISIIPDLKTNTKLDNWVPFFQLLPKSSTIWIENKRHIQDIIQHTVLKISEQHPNITLGETNTNSSSLLWTDCDLQQTLDSFSVMEFGLQKSENATVFPFHITPQPPFHKNFDLLIETLENNQLQELSNYILSDNPKQLERLRQIFEDKEAQVRFTALGQTLHQGFVDQDLRIACYTDHQIFNRYHKHTLRSDRHKKSKSSISLNELISLHPGDYIVHTDHGVGKFAGLHKITEDGKQQEVIKLIYQDNDILLVNLHALHKISKHKGKESLAPKINKLGTAAWQKLKQRTKSKVKDIAKELITLYANRKTQKGYAYTPDSFLQQELEASFLYEDTPDQEKATRAIKADMESDAPMDRLICGDVGFGKTELAIRAAFKAVCDNKQVAILVPTTILAFQHYNTFRKRLQDLPCRVDYLSRLRKTKDQTQLLKDLKAGKIDIIIGTHKLIGKSVEFKDMGLLIIDEEQRFGVAVKDKLKALKVNVDTLTLTATPIPRTLQFSLMGARDLSIIQTPPPNRHPITTELHGFNDVIIREAIMHELNRGGQIFFIHNRVQNINEVETYLNKIVPEASTIVSHGQMEGSTLEKNLLNFINGDYDILVATTIIESGLDIPNANTIIINQAHQFGLSELHQLRGRVGRSNTKAFCYLLAPPLQSLTNEARRRLKAIEEYADLGSGFNIAMQDLDIRGAGNILGGEQSGFISDIGYETYQRILDEAILELKTTDLKELFLTDNENENASEKSFFLNDSQIESDFEVLIPESYVENTSEKIKLYRELDNLKTEEELTLFATRLKDRFGEIPPSTLALMDMLRIRWVAIELGMERIILKRNLMICNLISDRESSFYESALFKKLLSFVQQQTLKCEISESRNKLKIKFKQVTNTEKALSILQSVLKNC